LAAAHKIESQASTALAINIDVPSDDKAFWWNVVMTSFSAQ
jgi:hypothetical protein